LLKFRENYLDYGARNTLKGSVVVAVRSHACVEHAGMNRNVKDLAEPVLGSRICSREFDDVNG
jgi:hypothetical protein